ncbi:MAG: MFS transporter [Candidatus Woesearchaeota archaeon]
MELKYLNFLKSLNHERLIFLYYTIFESIYLATFDRFIIPFLISKNVSNVWISNLIALIYLLSGIFGLFYANLATSNNRKKILVYTISFQVVSLFIFFILSFFNVSWYIYLILSLIILILQLSYAPVSTSLYGDLIKGNNDENTYLGIRAAIAEFTIFVISLIFSLLLDISLKWFVLIFLIAFLGRFLSLLILKRFKNPKTSLEKLSFKEFLKNMNVTNFGLFAEFLFFFYFAAYISVPFFTPYMFKELNFNYIQYFVINSLMSVVIVFFSPLIGKLCDKFGERAIFVSAGFIIATIPFLWTLSKNFVYLVFIEIFASFGWASFNLATADFLITHVDSKIRHSITAYIFFIRNLGIAIGSFLGSFLITQSTTIVGIFIVSSILRFLAVLLFGMNVKETKTVEKFKFLNFINEKLHQIKLLPKKSEDKKRDLYYLNKP